jgi:mediator of RNA polymerase II transcription subunit 17, fungi type
MQAQPFALPLPPPILQPIIDFLQYEVFCGRVKVELDRAVEALEKAGVRSTLRFEPIGDNGQQIVQLLEEHTRRKLSGEAVLRIDNRYVVLVYRTLYSRLWTFILDIHCA